MGGEMPTIITISKTDATQHQLLLTVMQLSYASLTTSYSTSFQPLSDLSMISCLEWASACCAKHRSSSLLLAKPEPRPPKENAALAMTGYSRYSAASKAC